MFYKKNLRGQLKVIGDKSISHRAVILSSISNGLVEVDNILLSKDLYNTIDCFRKMGVNISLNTLENKAFIKGVGINGLKKPCEDLYCGNSGTTMRLLTGLLAGQDFSVVLRGDSSLETRPMDRIIEPLTLMGANIDSQSGKAPLKVNPSVNIRPIKYRMPINSAQVKSAIQLLSIYSDEKSLIVENYESRDHTERMLDYFEKNNWIVNKLFIPGDISSASFLIVAALTLEGSHIILRDVGVNPTRAGILDVLIEMGANIVLSSKRIINNELVANIEVRYSKMKNIEINEEIMGRIIDEIPILAIAALFSKGRLVVSGARELRVKETDRIKAIVIELSKLGANITEKEDGFILEGGARLKPASLRTYGDHRMAMAFSILGLHLGDKLELDNVECIDISYPNFFEDIFENL